MIRGGGGGGCTLQRLSADKETTCGRRRALADDDKTMTKLGIKVCELIVSLILKMVAYMDKVCQLLLQRCTESEVYNTGEELVCVHAAYMLRVR